MDARELIIIGSGPAAYTAATYAARAQLQPLLFQGITPGGQLMITTDVENFPGFPKGVMGPELMAAMEEQARRFGTEMIYGDITRVDFQQHPHEVYHEDDDQTHRAKAVIIATGASARWLGLQSEERLRGRGVSACATCDGFFFKDQDVVIVGGGDSAMEEALVLTRFATRVTVIHRRDQLRASKIMQERAHQNDKIDFIWDSVVEEVLAAEGGAGVRGVLLRNVKSGETREFACQGLFVAIGHTPNTRVFEGQLELDEAGYIVVGEHTQTSVPGVFAAGDVVDHRYRQAVTAAGMGCMAALDAERWLASQ